MRAAKLAGATVALLIAFFWAEWVIGFSLSLVRILIFGS